jgi:hypothetical protein
MGLSTHDMLALAYWFDRRGLRDKRDIRSALRDGLVGIEITDTAQAFTITKS